MTLAAIVDRLRGPGPARLSAFLSRIGYADGFEAFLRIVREFVPEKEREILGQNGIVNRMSAFFSAFDSKYFGLDEGLIDNVLMDMEEEDGGVYEGRIGYWPVVKGIPVHLYGMDYDDVHAIAYDAKPGYLMMTSVIDLGDTGLRVTFLEALKETIPDLLPRIPENGLRIDKLQEIVEGTVFESLWWWGRYLTNDTGYLAADMTWEWGMDQSDLEWSRDNVDRLTEQEKASSRMFTGTRQLQGWLEEAPVAHFSILLDFLDGKYPNGVPRQLIETFTKEDENVQHDPYASIF